MHSFGSASKFLMALDTVFAALLYFSPALLSCSRTPFIVSTLTRLAAMCLAISAARNSLSLGVMVGSGCLPLGKGGTLHLVMSQNNCGKFSAAISLTCASLEIMKELNRKE